MSILSTPRSRKPILAVSALGVAGLLLAAVVIPMMVLSTWAERNLDAFPFKDEDWLRYLLPGRFERSGRSRLMLAGPSTVRENLRYELFERAFPDSDVFQGGFSLATLEDVTAALEYVENVYGAHALPDAIVLGISVRVVAGIPDDRPFVPALNRYSPYYSAVQERTRVVLKPKRRLDGYVARARFLVTKQPSRFRTALVAASTYWLSRGESSREGGTALVRTLDWMLGTRVGARIADMIGYSDARRYGTLELLRYVTAPYKYSLWPAIPMEKYLDAELYDPDGDDMWGPIYGWDPKRHGDEARARLRHFVEFVTRHNIPTLVVNMPERGVSRDFYDQASYRSYLNLVASELRGIEFVDLWQYLEARDFYDREHTTTQGSIRLTEEVIRLTRQTLRRPSLEAIDLR